MANFSNTVNTSKNPKANALGTKINSTVGAPHAVPPLPTAPRPNIFNSQGLGGRLANLGADIGGGLKNIGSGIAHAANSAVQASPKIAGAITSSPLSVPYLGLIPYLNKLGESMRRPQAPQSNIVNAQTTTETPQAPQTPAIKSQSTSPDGSTKTEYHPPEPAQPTQAPQTSASQLAATLPATKPTYANPLIQPAMDAQKRAVEINQALNQAINDRTKQGIALPFVQGQQAALQRDYGVQAEAATQAAQNAANLAGFGQPQVAGYGQTSFNPLTNSFGTSGGSTGGTTQVVGQNDPLYPAMQQYAKLRATGQESLIPGSISGNPALSAQLTDMAREINPDYNANTAGALGASQSSLQSQITNIEANKDQALGNFDTLIDYGKKFDAQTPIITGLKQLYAGTAGGDVQAQQAIAGFQSSLANIQKQYQDLTGADPVSAGLTPNVTPAALAQIKQDMQDKITNRLKNYNDELKKIKTPENTTSNAPATNTKAGPRSDGGQSLVALGDNSFKTNSNEIITKDANGNWVVKSNQ